MPPPVAVQSLSWSGRSQISTLEELGREIWKLEICSNTGGLMLPRKLLAEVLAEIHPMLLEKFKPLLEDGEAGKGKTGH